MSTSGSVAVTLLKPRSTKVGYDLTIQQSQDGSWRLLQYFDRTRAIEWNPEFVRTAVKYNDVSQDEAISWSGIEYRAATARQLSDLRMAKVEELYHRLVKDCVRVLLLDPKGRTTARAMAGGYASVVYKPARAKAVIILARLSIDTVA